MVICYRWSFVTAASGWATLIRTTTDAIQKFVLYAQNVLCKFMSTVAYPLYLSAFRQELLQKKIVFYFWSYHFLAYFYAFSGSYKGPFIYDVHTEGVRIRRMHVDGGRGQALCGRPHRTLKLKSTDIILSSSHAKKLVYFCTRISSLDGIKSGNFSAI